MLAGCGVKLRWESLDEREERLAIPHEWFAWFPVRIGPHDVRWLEAVLRSGEWVFQGIHRGNVWTWTYYEAQP